MATSHLPGYHPDGCEDDQHRLAGPAVLGVPQQLGQLQQRISAVVDDEDESSYSDEMSCPAEHNEGDGGLVVDEHLPEVLDAHQVQCQLLVSYLSLHVKELSKEKGPVERHLQHVVPPYSRVFRYKFMNIAVLHNVDLPSG